MNTQIMKRNENPEAVPGWIGGFAQSNPAFAYPDPNLSSLPVLGNLDNIPKIQRQQAIYWPEFSWLSKQGDPGSRVFQRFAHEISRVGYDDTGRVWSIICPQQELYISTIEGTINVEVTVTGQRGWADESTRELAAGMSVEATIWFSPSAKQSWLIDKAWDWFKAKKLPFPSEKENAIKVTTHLPGDPDQPLFPLRKGENPAYSSPDFARHVEEAWTVGNLAVQIGSIKKTGHDDVDDFNEQTMKIFNMASGNMLQSGNVLTWNLWFTAPELVDTEEWATHAERWRKSIQVEHTSPDGSVRSPARVADGSEFEAEESKVEEAHAFLKLLRSVI